MTGITHIFSDEYPNSCPIVFHLFDDTGLELSLITGYAPSYLNEVVTFATSGNYTYQYSNVANLELSSVFEIEINFCNTTSWLTVRPVTTIDGLSITLPLLDDSLSLELF
jgi:hypothetical protein